MAYARGDLLQRIVDINADAVDCYLAEQIAAGVDTVMLFDTWGGLLTHDHWRRFSLAPIQRVLRQTRALASREVPSIVFTKGAGARLRDFADSGANCVGIDWMTDLSAARRDVGDRLAVQGNLDPVALLTDPQTVERTACEVLQRAGPEPGHIFNLGHGIMPTTPPDNVAALVNAVHTHSREIRKKISRAP
jgi:uroporphyrinogen decarboxylase